MVPIHTVQSQAPLVQRKGRRGTTQFVDEPMRRPNLIDDVWRADMSRRVIAPASDTRWREEIHWDIVPVEFDTKGCEVRLPHRFAFAAGDSTTPGICEAPYRKPVKPVSPDRLARIERRYLNAVNEGLNGWFAVRLEGDGCEAPCAGVDIPIRVEATTAPPGPGVTDITVVNRSGRADSATLCALSLDRATMRHEGGHQVLGLGDEYRERSKKALATSPEWGRIERVQTDWSLMGSDHRLSELYERHFGHVTAFLAAALPDCNARLVPLRRPVNPDLRVAFEGGTGQLEADPTASFGFGLAVGVPISRMREWELVIGPNIRMLMETRDDLRLAYLLGARVGLERAWGGPITGGFRVGGFAEVGGAQIDPPLGTLDLTRPPRGVTTPYGELGATGGVRSPALPGVFIGAEAAVGTELTYYNVPPEYRDSVRDEAALQWFRAGLRMTWEF